MDTNELSLFREHCFGDAEVVKRKFTNKYRLPYICSECMEELGLCMGDKNVAYFRHSSSNIGCGGVGPIHKAFVASVAKLGTIETIDNGRLEFSQDSIEFEKTIGKNRFDFVFKDSRFFSRIGVEIDFTSKTTEHSSELEHVYKVDIVNAFNELSEKFGNQIDFTRADVMLEVDRLSSEFLFSRVYMDTENTQMSLFSRMEISPEIKIPDNNITIPFWEKAYGRLLFYIKKIFYHNTNHRNL